MRSPIGALASFTNRAPVPYAPRAGSGGRFPLLHRAGREQQLRAMGSVGTVFAIVNRQAKAVGAAEWKLYRKASSGRDEDRTEVTSHAALDLWNSPNPFFNRQVFAEAGSQHKLLTGETWWVIAQHERANLPLELWPVRPDRMEPVPDPDNFLTGYMYYGPSGEQIALRKEDVIFIRTPNPLDPYRGIGPVQSILMDIDATRYSAEWNRNFFLNSAEPGGVVEVDRRLGEQEFNELRARWAEQHKGVANAHRVALLENGMKWVERSFSQRDMQFVELRSVAREVIREAFGFPKAMLGTSEDVNRANAEAGEVMFARWLIVPELDAIKAALNTQLLPLYGATGRGLEFDYVSPVPEDEEAASRTLTAQAQAAQTLRSAGWDAADVLSATGLPEMGARDPREQLLVDIVRGAPSTAPLILPLLGFDLPAAPATSAGPENLLGDGGLPEVEDAARWVVEAHDDDNVCKPCHENDGHVYRTRREAYSDYPGGEGYKHCVGAEYGNECRCKVVKRRGRPKG